MDLAQLIAVASGLISIITGAITVVGFINKNKKNKQLAINVLIVALVMITILTGSITLTIILSRPVVKINQTTSTPLPDNPSILGSNNTVIIATKPPKPTPVTKTIQENRKLVCIRRCSAKGLTVILNKIVINMTDSHMTWHFTIIYNAPDNLSTCPEMNVPLSIKDPSGKATDGGPPGTLTEQKPINDGQTLQEYATIQLIPQLGIIYTLNARPACHFLDNAVVGSNVYQLETFTF